MNELARVLRLIEAYEESRASLGAFAKRRGLHPSSLSRILRVGKLPEELLSELASFERLSRTHLEVIATAPPERRSELVSWAREGRSTYRIRERRETTAVKVSPPSEPTPGAATPPAQVQGEPESVPSRVSALARALDATPEETRDFALELLSVLLRSSPGRVRSSLEQFRQARVR
jgi:ParB-like chromosome segregation protein Spo0J